MSVATSSQNEIGFEAVTMQGAAKLAQLWETLKELLQDCDFLFTKQGIHINSSDTDNCAFISMTLYSDAFQRYVCKRSYHCCLNIEHLFKIFKSCGRAQQSNRETKVTFRLMSDDPDNIYFCMANPSSGLRSEVNLATKRAEKELLEVEPTLYDRYIEMQSVEFQSMISYIANLSSDDNTNVITIEMFSDDSVEFSSHGAFGQLKVVVREKNNRMSVVHGEIDALSQDLVRKPLEALADDNEGAEDDDDEDEPSSKRQRRADDDTSAEPAERTRVFHGQYNAKYLKMFTKGAVLTQYMRIFLAENQPALFTYAVGTMGVLHFLLAPVPAEENVQS